MHAFTDPAAARVTDWPVLPFGVRSREIAFCATKLFLQGGQSMFVGGPFLTEGGYALIQFRVLLQ